MNRRFLLITAFVFVLLHFGYSQNYTFDFNNNGRRVCLVSSEVDLSNNTVKIFFHDSLANTFDPIYISRRTFGTNDWTSVADALPVGTGHWVDNNVAAGDIWEYQIRRQNTWNYQSMTYDAIGYTIGNLQNDHTDYKGQMILLVASDIPISLPEKYTRLKKELTGDSWLVNELIVAKASSWDSGNEVVEIKNQITSIYTDAPFGDKPKALFILGHVPLPRCGSTNVTAPDGHDENKGARGCDAYYADIDGLFTDTATYNPIGLVTSLAENLPSDFKWDQDFFPSDIEMAFGRIDFADLTDISTPELSLIEAYLDRLSNYKNVASGFDMGEKSAFYFGYDNSNDDSYRSLFNISKPDHVYQNYDGPNHNQWVEENGPFKIYMQNLIVPSMNDWQTYGMNATVYSSDQSYWGFGDVPQPAGVYSRIRSLLGVDSKCLVTLWTTTGVNIFHQACTGEALGIAMQKIMNHNNVNQYLEKPPQGFDTPEWWNRSHFTFYGDPTLNLYQTSPASDLSIASAENSALVQWTNSTDADILGYHIYESDSEFGKFERITDTPINANSYLLPDYQEGNWYMVKAVKSITSGCGQFIHSSLGVTIQGDFILNDHDIENKMTISFSPNPVQNYLYLDSSTPIENMKIYSMLGHQVYAATNLVAGQSSFDLSFLPNNVYFIRLQPNGQNQQIETYKIIKTN